MRCVDHSRKESEIDVKALYKIGYGLYVVTSNDGKDNGLIVNTVTQLTGSTFKIAVSINKLCYSHDVIKKTGLMNVNTLNNDSSIAIFQNMVFVLEKKSINLKINKLLEAKMA